MTSRQPFPKICVALGLPRVETLLEHAKREIENGETFLEFRLDYLDQPEKGLPAIKNFLASYPEATLLATCRRRHNHGRFDGSVEHELAILNSAIDHGAHAVDVEIETAEVAAPKLAGLRDRARLIISWHNFETTPNLEVALRRLTRIPADAYKLVTTARKPSDVGRVLAVGKHNPRTPLVILAMGETGFATRVLSPACNGIFTYAAPTAAEGTAAGQVSSRQLRKQYRADRLSRSTKIFCIIGDPIGHSLSPVIHNRAFQLRRIDAVYVPMLANTGQLRDFMKLANELPIAGFSVTIPHKQKIMRYLDHIEPLARRIGAVNTVWRKAGKWRGTNTDAAAVIKPLEEHLTLARSRVLIAGSGGAARAAACALSDAGASVFITGRNFDRTRMLARFAGGQALTHAEALAAHFDAVVHATPLGTFPNTDASYFDETIPADVVFDMVYNPLDTLLIRRAREQGKHVIPGMRMFIEQAVAQFELWTGEPAPRPAMEAAALEALEHADRERKGAGTRA
jgi:3-dehydroquinate dehydratase/shikimate dehydrogenase